MLRVLKAVLLVAALSSVATCSELPRYEVIDLGVPNDELPYTAWADAISDTGRIVGQLNTYGKTTGGYHAFYWEKDSGVVDLGVVSGEKTASRAMDVNSAGTVVGASQIEEDKFGIERACIWVPGSQPALLAASCAIAASVNEAGIVCGVTGSRPFLWDSSKGFQTIDFEGQFWDINNRGQVAACGGGMFFVWQQGKDRIPIPPLSQNAGVVLRRLNDKCQVVGFATAADGKYHAFVWDAQTGTTDLGSPGTESRAYDINNSGVVVGSSEGLNPRAFVWTRDSGLTHLDSCVDPSPGWRLTRALAINNKGWIAGIGRLPGSYVQRGVLLKPIAGAK